MLAIIGVKQLSSRLSSLKNGPKLVMSAFLHPLTPAMSRRLWWGVVRASVTMIMLTALPSLLGLVTIFDCTRIESANGDVIWMSDMSRDKECFNGNDFYTFAVLHAIVFCLWLLIIALYARESRETGNAYIDISLSSQVCYLSFIIVYFTVRRHVP